MTRAFFVTGTDTEIGKTTITAALTHWAAQAGRRSVAVKPVAAGQEAVSGPAGLHWVNEDVARLHAASNLPDLSDADVGPLQLRTPCAPHIAAALEGVSIDRTALLSAVRATLARAEVGFVEGVGGFCVPLTADWDTADLAAELALPVVLVVGLRLGCINHALLTAQAIRARGLALAGWVGNTVDATQPHQADNLTALADRLNAPCWGVVPRLGGSAPGAADVASHLNTAELHTALLA